MANKFERYMHIERFGTPETAGIENGLCYIFPKIDGTNSQIWFDGILMAGSRNRKLSIENDNAGFYQWVLEQDNIDLFFHKCPNLRLYGEWLVPHTLKTYTQTAWRHFYVFDVMDGEKYLPYEEYKAILDEFEIEYIPPICKVNNPTYERLIAQLESNTYLIEDGKGVGEGVVIKNYEYRNKYGRITWAKIVRNEFKAKHQRCETNEIKECRIIEEEIVNKFVTSALVEKEYAKIDNEIGWSSKNIPQLLNVVYYCLVKEDCWNFIKEFKYPQIDFKRLQHFTTSKVKEVMPQIF